MLSVMVGDQNAAKEKIKNLKKNLKTSKSLLSNKYNIKNP